MTTADDLNMYAESFESICSQIEIAMLALFVL